MDCRTAQQKIMAYIQRQLNDRELEDFIEHIQNCPTCSEELEVYFTIYYALEKLDQDEQGSYNMQELLEKDLEQAKRKVQKRIVLKFYRRLFLAVCAFVVVMLAGNGIQAMITGSVESTFLYTMFHEQAESKRETEMTAAAVFTEKETAEPEPETNRKFQIIITVPETEYITEKVIDLTGGNNAVSLGK